ncbi:MAG: hypothetical protein Q9159_005168 [Coniocarpon cinnabarinum]
MSEQVNKAHRKSKEKKQRPQGAENPKAHAFAKPGKYQKQAARSSEIKERRLHVPLVDRIPEEAPPLVVGVVGPPGVGKTTLVKSLIRRYAKQTLSDPKGPLTVVTSKKRRLTFFECPSDSLASMIDVAKVVDIVLLMIDGHYGFEMETMEFLNVLSSSGMPGNVFGILTHLDQFKKQDTLRTRKKQLKHRFWSELYQGAKLFYLSGIINGRYPDREVLNISRFLSVMKNPRPLVWRNTHPYCLADRFLDVTPPTQMEDNPKCDRQIALYGYLRGTNLPANGAKVHVPGLGDLEVSQVEALSDPCPTPHMDQQIAKATGSAKKRRLGEKQKILFAPMSDVGGVLVDKDAVYIDIKQPTFDAEDGTIENKGFGEQMVVGLQGDRRLLGRVDGGVRLFEDQVSLAGHSLDENGETDHRKAKRRRPLRDLGAESLLDEAYVSGSGTDTDERLKRNRSGSWESMGHGKGVNAEDEDRQDNNSADSDSDIDSFDDENRLISASSSEEGGAVLDDNDSDIDDDDDVVWKKNLTEKARAAHTSSRVRQTRDLVKLLYNTNISPVQVTSIWNGDAGLNDVQGEKENGEEELLTHRKLQDEGDAEDRLIAYQDLDRLEDKWTKSSTLQRVESRFASAHTSGGQGDVNESDDDAGSAFEDDSEGDGDFEDLEATGEDNGPKPEQSEAAKSQAIEDEREKNARRKEELKLRFEAEDAEGIFNEKSKIRADAEQDEFGEDDWYDAQKAQMQKQLDINRAEYEGLDERTRINVEGYKAGTYVRLVLKDVPYEFARNFSPRYPIIIGGLTATENRFGFLQVRIKCHRWHSRILKSNDPLIFSLGWRRFQSIPLYHLSDSRTRNRLLKYTPEHMHCFGTLYGPLVAPNTGFSCVQSFSQSTPGFRIAATGVVLNVDESTEIVKKLKLKGFPHKVFKNTAIIRDMFRSDLEIAKFKSGNLRTVSGVRGMVKGAAGRQFPEGYIRAGFEDKILKSDIVFLSSWATVRPREFYMPMTNLLTDASASKASTNSQDQQPDKTEWQGMRTTGQVRAAFNLRTPQNHDSNYRPINRPDRHFNPLRVPRKLAQDLPFKSQITTMKPQSGDTYLQRRAVVLGGEEKKARDLMQKLFTLRNEKVQKRKLAQEKRKELYRRRVAEGLEMKAAREKREKEVYWKKEGKKRARQEEGGGARKKTKR